MQIGVVLLGLHGQQVELVLQALDGLLHTLNKGGHDKLHKKNPQAATGENLM